MKHETFSIQVQGSQDYAKVTTYILGCGDKQYTQKRPCILIMPGGGYNHLAEYKEGEVYALNFGGMGYHAAVLEYSVAPAAYPTQLLEVASAVKLLRDHASEWNIDTDKIFVCGSSAGGHLAAHYGCAWSEDFVAEALGVTDKELLRPNGMILCYPVITSGPKAHRGSFVSLCGDKYEELVDRLSVERLVNKDTPRAFIWHTFADASVPVENSLLFAEALRAQDIPFELHIYPVGRHGLGLANWATRNAEGLGVEPQCQSWISLVKTWLEFF